MRKGGFVLVILMLAVTAGCSSGTATVSGNGGGSVSPGHSSPKAAVEGFITDLESDNGGTAWCSYLYAPDRSFCQEGITVTGTFALGNQFIDGTSALVAITGDLCAHADLGSTTSIACNKNSDPNKGLPKSANTFSEAYAAASVSFGTVTAPCHEVKGIWYLDVDVLVVSGTPTTSPTTTPSTTPTTVPSTIPSTIPTTTTTQAPATGPPPAGSYSGTTAQNLSYNHPVEFYVSNTKTALQDITFSALELTCAPGNSTPVVAVSINSVSLNSNGSFASTSTQNGYYNGSGAKFTIDFEGNFQGLNSDGVAQAAGSISETMTYSANGSSYTCTSDEVSWSDTRDTQQTVTMGLPPAGSYIGASAQNLAYNHPLEFFVSNTKTTLQNITLSALELTCAPGNSSPVVAVSINSVSLNSDGSFASTSTQTRSYDGSGAKFTVNFEGNFHGLNSDGVARAAGSITETMTYSASGTSYTCSSNQIAWSVSHT